MLQIWSQEVEFVLILFSFAAPGQEEALWHHVSRSLQAKFSRPEPIERVVCWLILINLQASPSFSHLYSSFFPSPTPSLPRWRHHQRRLKTATKSKLTTSQSQTSLCSLFSFPVFPKPVKYMVSQSRHFHARVWPSVGKGTAGKAFWLPGTGREIENPIPVLREGNGN